MYMYTKCNVPVVTYMHVCLYIYSVNKNERTCRDVITQKLRPGCTCTCNTVHEVNVGPKIKQITSI